MMSEIWNWLLSTEPGHVVLAFACAVIACGGIATGIATFDTKCTWHWTEKVAAILLAMLGTLPAVVLLVPAAAIYILGAIPVGMWRLFRRWRRWRNRRVVATAEVRFPETPDRIKSAERRIK